MATANKVTPLLSDQEKQQDSYRLPPYNVEAEQLVLGNILTNNENLTKIADFLFVSHFYVPIHQRIYESIIKFVDRGLIATPVTLKNIFEKDEALAELGGASYLAKIAGLAMGIIDIDSYAKTIHDLAVRRMLIDIGTDMVNQAYVSEAATSAFDQLEKNEHKLFELASEGSLEKSSQHLKVSLTDSIKRAEFALKNKDSISGVPTGLLDLDKLMGGMHDSDLIIIAARPSMGKTALAINIAVNSAKHFYDDAKKLAEQNEGFLKSEDKAKSVGFFSLEMSAEQIATRMLSMETGVSSSSIRRGKLDKEKHEFEKLISANKKLFELPFYIDETPAISISALRTRARRLKRKHNLGLLVIDYLQLIRGVSDISKTNRVQEVSEITQGLKAIAKELDIPVIALSQLSRQVEQRDDKRPQLADLRESGTIEQDSDVVMFIYREEYYKEREKPREATDEKSQEKMMKWQDEMAHVHNVAEIMVAKHRNGPIGNIEVHFDKITTVFKNLEKDH